MYFATPFCDHEDALAAIQSKCMLQTVTWGLAWRRLASSAAACSKSNRPAKTSASRAEYCRSGRGSARVLALLLLATISGIHHVAPKLRCPPPALGADNLSNRIVRTSPSEARKGKHCCDHTYNLHACNRQCATPSSFRRLLEPRVFAYIKEPCLKGLMAPVCNWRKSGAQPTRRTFIGNPESPRPRVARPLRRTHGATRRAPHKRRRSRMLLRRPPPVERATSPTSPPPAEWPATPLA